MSRRFNVYPSEEDSAPKALSNNWLESWEEEVTEHLERKEHKVMVLKGFPTISQDRQAI